MDGDPIRKVVTILNLRPSKKHPTVVEFVDPVVKETSYE
jgi:hypothetical protein